MTLLMGILCRIWILGERKLGRLSLWDLTVGIQENLLFILVKGVFMIHEEVFDPKRVIS